MTPIANKPLPTSTARVATEKAGAALVQQKLVTPEQLQALLKDPVLSSSERAQAAALVGALRARIETGALSTHVEGALKTFEGAVANEANASDRIGAARDALSNNAIDDALFARLSGAHVGLRGVLGLGTALTSAVVEAARLKPLADNAGPDTKAALDHKLADAVAKRDALLALGGTVSAGAGATARNVIATAGGIVAAGAALALLLHGGGAPADPIEELGHMLVFIMGPVFAGVLSAQGIHQLLLPRAPNPSLLPAQ